MDMQPSPGTDSSLEGSPTMLVSNGGSDGASSVSPESPRPPKSPRRLKLLPIVIIVGLILLLAGVGFGYSSLNKSVSRKAQPTVVVNTQSLDNGTLNKLSVQAGQNGSVRQELTIAASTIFKNSVTVQNAATFEGDLTVKGTSNLLGPVATGSNLAVGGSMTVAHNSSIGANLSVSGTISAGSLNVGAINLSALKLSGDLSFGGHIVPNGVTPTGTPGVIGNSDVHVDGNDTAGTVTINLHNGQLIPGEMATIHFHTPFALTPRVQLTPVNPDGAKIQYYATQSPGFFTIQTASTPSANTSYSFNYFVTD